MSSLYFLKNYELSLRTLFIINVVVCLLFSNKQLKQSTDSFISQSVSQSSPSISRPLSAVALFSFFGQRLKNGQTVERLFISSSPR